MRKLLGSQDEGVSHVNGVRTPGQGNSLITGRSGKSRETRVVAQSYEELK